MPQFEQHSQDSYTLNAVARSNAFWNFKRSDWLADVYPPINEPVNCALIRVCIFASMEVESVGDSSRNILRNVKRTAKILLQAATEEDGKGSSQKLKSLDELLR